MNEFFTDLDPRITGTSESDPMGLLPVWTGFAGHLFRNRVNSRINDLRAYTINLFHVWIVRRIRQDLSEANWQPEERSHFGQGHFTSFTRALMVLQEKILLASLCMEGDAFDDEGILGLTTARRKGKDGIRLNLHHSNGEVLVRQAQLGFSGAYRSAFTNGIGLLDPTTGHPREDKAKWADVEVLFLGIPVFKQLAEAIEGLVVGLLKNGKSNELTLRQLEDKELPKLQRQCFGNRAQLCKQFAPFWHTTLELDKGETASLWNAVSSTMRSVPAQEHVDSGESGEAPEHKRLSPKELFQNGLKDGAECVRIINEIAPFLARVEQIFVVLRASELTSLESAGLRLAELFGGTPLVAVLPRIENWRILTALPSSGVARGRLSRLFKMADHDALALIPALLEYHKEDVCRPRGAQAWLEILDGAWRCHVVSDRRIEKPKEGEFPWEHDFYAGAFQSLALEIKDGLEP